MKKIYLLTAALIFGVVSAQAQQTWDNFEDIRYGQYTFTNGPLIPYFANPGPDAGNDSEIVASYTRTNQPFDAIVLTNNTFDNVTDNYCEDVVNYVSESKTITMDVWSPIANTPLLLVLQNSVFASGDFPAGRHSEYTATTSVTAGWETLEFNFAQVVPGSGVTSDQIDQMAILFWPNTDVQETFYFDNINGPEFDNDPCADVTPSSSVFNDFECQQNVNFFFSSAGTGFTKIANPDPSGNESSFVAQYNRNGNATDGNDVIQGDFGSPLQLTATSTISLDVWAPASGTTVRLALQNGNGDEVIAVDAQTTAIDAWETLTFDVSAVSAATDIELFVILFNPGDDSFETYYFDNFQGTDLSVSVEEIDLVQDLTVFPNPSVNEANFQYTLLENSNIRFTLTDITGRVVENQNFDLRPSGTHQFAVNTGAFASGVYIYSIRTDKGTASGRLVISK